MITHPVHEQLKTLTSSVNDLINILNQSKNVSSDAKNILLNYNIDISNSWKSNDIYINKLSSGLTKVVNNNNIELFTITNESAKLTHFNSGKIKYEDLNSQTILLLDRLHFKTVTIQENDGKKILLDSIETDKLLNSLQVSKTLDSMLSNVNNVSEKISKLESKNKKQKSAAFLDSELSVESILDKIKQTKASHEIVFKPNLNKPSN